MVWFSTFLYSPINLGTTCFYTHTASTLRQIWPTCLRNIHTFCFQFLFDRFVLSYFLEPSGKRFQIPSPSFFSLVCWKKSATRFGVHWQTHFCLGTLKETSADCFEQHCFGLVIDQINASSQMCFASSVFLNMQPFIQNRHFDDFLEERKEAHTSCCPLLARFDRYFQLNSSPST